MPELPEVQLMCERLQKYVGWRVIDITTDLTMSAAAAAKYLPGREAEDLYEEKITGIFRRGKYLIFNTTEGAILCHNAMSGYWDSSDEPWTFDYVEGARVSTDRDVRLKIGVELFGQMRYLRFHDARKFGSVRFVSPETLAQKLSTLGPEPIVTPHIYEPSGPLSIQQLKDALEKRISKLGIKPALMKQEGVVGIGNIYSAEICYESGILPNRCDLNEQEITKIYGAISTVLKRALDEKLTYANYLKVYRKKICPKGHEISVGDMDGRSTYWCEICQS